MKTTLTFCPLRLLALCLQLSACTELHDPAGDNPQLLDNYVASPAADTQEKFIAGAIDHGSQYSNSTLVGQTDVSPTQRVRLISGTGPTRSIPLYH